MGSPMSSNKDPFIQVNQLSKCYQVYHRPQDRLKQAQVPRLQRLLMMKPRQFYREFELIYPHRILDAVIFRVQAYVGRITNALDNFDIASMAASAEQ
jgi:hypothetical protein